MTVIPIDVSDSSKVKERIVHFYPRRLFNTGSTSQPRENQKNSFIYKAVLFLIYICCLVVLIVAASRTHNHWHHYRPQFGFTLILVDEIPLKSHSSAVQVVSPVCENVDDKLKLDCLPDQPTNSQACLERGCCWKSLSNNISESRLYNVPLSTPYCYYPSNYENYQIILIQYEASRTVVTLKNSGISTNIPNQVQFVRLEVIELDSSHVRVRFTDISENRWEVPLPKLNLPTPKEDGESLYAINISPDDSRLVITRRSTNVVIFDSDLRRLVFADQLIKLTNQVSSKTLYGLGEHVDKFAKDFNWRKYTMFNRDIGPTVNANLYGSYPFYMMIEEDGNSHGVMLFNSNAMDVILQPTPAVTYIVTGGILDFFIFMGPTPKDVIHQNINLLGKPVMPPYWALGFHLCRYGYNSLNNTRATWLRTREAQIPFDVQWNDIDYMENYNDFTHDKEKFSGLRQFIDEIHQNKMHYVLIFDPGVSGSESEGSYPPFDDGIKMDIFVKNRTNQVFFAKVWNLKSTVYPDFTNPKTTVYWTRQFARFHKEFPFDGAWIDMNEPSNFFNGESYGCSNTSLHYPPYTPGDVPLSTKTLCMDAKHHVSIHYNVHNLYGLYETKATNLALRVVRKKRPFIISRASFFGQGHFGSHWSGDIWSTWEQMQWSIANMLEFNMFGTPMVGSDICGFNGNTTVELCTRWSALGAFYPFSRNHNTDDAKDQDPVALGEAVVAAARNALNLRYKFLPYLYTLFYRAHRNGETVARPLFFEYNNETETRLIEDQFLWGSSLMVLPILEAEKTTRSVYLPKNIWYIHNKTGNGFIPYDGKASSIELEIPKDEIAIALRGGSVFATHSGKPLTTVDAVESPYELIIAPCDVGRAHGEVFIDDGDSLDSIILGNFGHYVFEYDKNTLKLGSLNDNYDAKIGFARFLGFKQEPKYVVVNEKSIESFHFDPVRQELNVKLTESFKTLKKIKIVP